MFTLSTASQTIGKNTRNYVGGDSTVSYPVLSSSSNVYVLQDPLVSPSGVLNLFLSTRDRERDWDRSTVQRFSKSA